MDREKERTNAIRNGLLADPNKRTRLEDAITVVGTCQDMCPEFERIQRIREQAIERPEKVGNYTAIMVDTLKIISGHFGFWQQGTKRGVDGQMLSQVGRWKGRTATI